MTTSHQTMLASSSNQTTAMNSQRRQAVVTKPPPTRRTFYQRPLPDSCTAFSSPTGKRYLASAMQHDGLASFYALMEQHSTQTEPSYCGLSTLVIALNALAVDPRQTWKGPWRWYTESMLNCCVDLQLVKETGITLAQFHCLAKCQGLVTEMHYARQPASKMNHETTVDQAAAADDDADTANADDDDDDDGVEQFRMAVKRACMEPSEDDDNNPQQPPPLMTILVVSYSRKVLGQTGSGHFSPIAAYDPVSDHVLILDTARFKYGTHWVPLPLLYQAMQPIDPDTNKPRGYFLLTTTTAASTTADDHHLADDAAASTTSQQLEPAILLLSPQKQKHARRLFKEHFLLNDHKHDDNEPTLQQVLDFCAKQSSSGTSLSFVWQMTQAHLKPTHDEHYYYGDNNSESNDNSAAALVTITTRQLIAEMQTLLDQLLVHHQHKNINNHQHQPTFVSASMDKNSDYNYCEQTSNCRPNYSRTIDVTARQVAFLLYLALLPETRRMEIIYQTVPDNDTNNDEETKNSSFEIAVSDLARRQLLVEAALLRLAIDVSDSDEL